MIGLTGREALTRFPEKPVSGAWAPKFRRGRAKFCPGNRVHRIIGCLQNLRLPRQPHSTPRLSSCSGHIQEWTDEVASGPLVVQVREGSQHVIRT